MKQVEKIARLIGLEVNPVDDGEHLQVKRLDGEWTSEYDPLTNKADLMDLENALHSIVVNILPSKIEFWAVHGQYHAESVVYFDNHPDKFTARAAAVCAVAEQIYDRRTEPS